MSAEGFTNGSEVTLTVITPTLGRPTLAASIRSCVDQLEDGDEMVVVTDWNRGDRRSVREIVEDFLPAHITLLEAGALAEDPARASSFGNLQRDQGLAYAAGRSSHVAFLDDDDVFLHGALDVIRSKVFESSFAHIFRAEWGPGHHAHGVRLWVDREVRESNIATPMCVLPNRPYSRTWMDGNDRYYVSDYAWLSAAIGECDGVCWHEETVAVVRP